jgi:O-antigen ligase
MPMLPISKKTRIQVVTAMLLLMLIGLFLSRALLSIGMAGFCMSVFILYGGAKNNNRSVWMLLIGFALLFLPCFASGLWSTQTGEWYRRCVVKLPLMLLPAAFFFYKPNRVAIFLVNVLFVFFVTCGSLYSIYEYALGVPEIESGYLRAKVMPVLVGNDHIRFSWLTVIAIILILYLQKEIYRRSHRVISLIILSWLVVFLHILAVKTGLVMLYLAALMLFVHHCIQKKKKTQLLFLLLLPLIPFLAWHTLPTFKKRVQYAVYDYEHYATNSYREGLSDGMRILSVQTGLQLFTQHPLTGTGFGDMEHNMQQLYIMHHPEVKPYERILPSSQFLLYASGAGIGGVLFFLAGIVMPLTRKFFRSNIYFLSFYLPALLSFIFEIHLESQYGCFIFCFFALWMGIFTSRLKSV